MKLKWPFTFSCTLLTSLIATTTYAFCVYNATTGNDTIRYLPSGKYYSPTIITMQGLGEGRKDIDQGDYGCILTSRRGKTDVTTVNIFYLQDLNRIPTMICSKNLYNKGGYMVVTGNVTSGFNCDVYRDKIKS